MRLVKWRNVWNWTGEEGGTTRLHLTNDDGLAGKTLCGRAFPRAKGYPFSPRYCKVCVRKARLTGSELRSLEYVPSAEE